MPPPSPLRHYTKQEQAHLEEADLQFQKANSRVKEVPIRANAAGPGGWYKVYYAVMLPLLL